MNNEPTDDEKRVHIIRMGMQVLNALLVEQFGKQYNLIVVACPTGEKVVSLVTRVENEIALDGMLAVAVNTLRPDAANTETMQ